MANIDITFTPPAAPFPFELDIARSHYLEKTALPRGRVTFQQADGVVTAKIATNTTTVNVVCTLPANYAYVFEYASVQIAFDTDTADAANFENVGMMLVNLGDGLGGRRAQFFSRGQTGDSLNAGSQIAWAPLNVFPSPIFNLQQNSPNLILRFYDTDAGATEEGLLSAVVSLLQYDIEQIFNVGVNFPVPVSIR